MPMPVMKGPANWKTREAAAMTLKGRIDYNEDPMVTAVKGMTMQIGLLNYYTDNIAFADTPGYQRKVPVVTSFAEQLGIKGVDTVTDTSVGRLFGTHLPLDFALNSKGYFQKLHADGHVELTRDGRCRMDKNGNLLSTDLMPILGRDGKPIKFPVIPDQLSHVKVAQDGTISVQDPKTGTSQYVGQIGVVLSEGKPAKQVEVRQGVVEASNIFLHEEFIGMVAPKREFEANRQMFITQSQNLSRLIQDMGRA